jgi:EAL domain-containing protein (putative c-di-GMP-specific phosphodiesterase class I)
LRLWSELRPDYVRVEQHFVRGLHKDKVKRAFIRSLHTLAVALGTRLIAEGVETYDEFHRLEEIGVDLMQGYFFARPQAQPDMELAPGLLECRKSRIQSLGSK